MKKLRVDRWCEETQTVLEYDSCFYQGHDCITKRSNLPDADELAERDVKTKAKHTYIRDMLSTTLEVMQECTWNRECKALNMGSRSRYYLTETKILARVKAAGTLFGSVLCDVHVPNNPTARKKFAEMTAIF